MILFKNKKIWMALILCVFFSACGFRFLGSGNLPGGVEKVHVDILENSTSETGIENIFTNALRYEFIRQKKNASKESADGFLSGKIESLSYKTITHRRRHTSIERRVTVNVAMDLKDREGNILWFKEVSANEAYDVTPDKLSTEQNKTRAISELSERLAENAYYSLTDNF
ncbi:MAG: LPS assembly lipoprotein LptE [Desulfobacterales bacterium]|nr:LPS assembly lipoprotein LptE [Desulfobacterales bacterium]